MKVENVMEINNGDNENSRPEDHESIEISNISNINQILSIVYMYKMMVHYISTLSMHNVLNQSSVLLINYGAGFVSQI